MTSKSLKKAGLLPAKRSKRRLSLIELAILMYGVSKIGKSTFFSGFRDALFVSTEPGLNALEVFEVPVTSWEEFLAVCSAIAEGNHPFKLVVIDTVDNLYKLASDFVRRKLGIDHESDAPYGKGFGLVNDELHRTLHKLSFLPYGLALISHAEDREIETRTGKVSRTLPSLPDKARRIVLSLVDMILFAEMEEVRGEDGNETVRRVIRTTPSSRFEAGDRTGLLPEKLDLDFPTFLSALERPTLQKE